MNATTYCIRCLRRSRADCRIGDAVEASRIPEWDSATESRSFHPDPARQQKAGSDTKSKPTPWKFRRTSIPGLYDAMDWVWVRVL